ncbi:MAG: hypothetical protein PHT69_07230 [Bacteroidales bacterium]|nr:hypothetical protein [Bacteroidales bacterium]
MRTILMIAAFFFLHSVSAQDLLPQTDFSGGFSLGARSSIGLVNDGKWQKPAFGTGGHFRLQFSERVNSEWFADHLKADLSNYGWRADTHIGWSLIYYLSSRKKPIIMPYVLAGHCFEYLKFTENINSSNYAERWSASVQGGLGTHFNLTDHFDFSLGIQYMLHLGTKIVPSNNNGITSFTNTKGAGIHDHVLLHLSINYKIADLW